MMIGPITAGSLTTNSVAPIGLCRATSASARWSGAPAHCSTSARTPACGFSTELRLVWSRIS